MQVQRIVRTAALFAALVSGFSSVGWAQDTPQRVRVGGEIKEPRKIKDLKPAYPEEARRAGIQGIVIIETLIGTDGNVVEAKVLRPAPMLEQPALDAVMQWKYTPTLLNGQPVEVLMTVTVTFSLSQGDLQIGSPDQPSTPVAAAVDWSKIPAAPEATPVRVGAAIAQPKKIKDVKPVYPAPAREQRLSGIVIMEIIIDVDGNVSDAKVLRTAPEFEEAAVAAVRQWKYEPTLLNGVRIPIIMTVTVTFTIAE